MLHISLILFVLFLALTAFVIFKNKENIFRSKESLFDSTAKISPLILSSALFFISYQQARTNAERLDELRADERPFLVNSIIENDFASDGKSGTYTLKLVNTGKAPGKIVRIRSLLDKTNSTKSKGEMTFSHSTKHLSDANHQITFGPGALQINPGANLDKEIMEYISAGYPLSVIFEIDYCEIGKKSPRCFIFHMHHVSIYQNNSPKHRPIVVTEFDGVESKTDKHLTVESMWGRTMQFHKAPHNF